MSNNTVPTFIELTIVESEFVNVPRPRKGLIDIAMIAGLEELGNESPLKTRCAVMLHWPTDTSVENDNGEQVVRGQSTLMVQESYESIVAMLENRVQVIRPSNTK